MSSLEHSPQSEQTGRPPRKHRRSQLAAVAALIAAFFVFWLAVSMVANDPVGLVFAFLAVFGLVWCIWYFLIRRGLKRLLVLPLALLAVIALFTYAYDQKYQLGVVVIALVVFGLAARYAVRNHPESAPSVHRYARPADPAERGVLIINPKSGGGKAERFNLAEEAKKRRIEPLLLGPDDDLCGLASRAVKEGADVIGMGGGDG